MGQVGGGVQHVGGGAGKGFALNDYKLFKDTERSDGAETHSHPHTHTYPSI